MQYGKNEECELLELVPYGIGGLGIGHEPLEIVGARFTFFSHLHGETIYKVDVCSFAEFDFIRKNGTTYQNLTKRSGVPTNEVGFCISHLCKVMYER